ncbi:OLC1v1017642C1 [Oldenlandia corymbosa var. corymbosa]|uniref:OLC1v1017642C1 n=1 Tax=Oldenlandia corymbosa var. corymbosa TaxID=529605 RepID=A0AAV1E9V7_OLDCO|nr:OLC1v1017642C1 [Oldenlandia corymbosa var. corymbosa]
MEKSRSFPQYSSSYSYSNEFGFQQEEDGSKSNYNNSSSSSYTFNGPSSGNDPEMKRKKRIAAYNMFTTEGKLKATMRDSFKWIKSKFSTDVRYGT